MEENIKNKLLASIMLQVIDKNLEVQKSAESDEWILGYHEACDMVLEHLDELNEQWKKSHF